MVPCQTNGGSHPIVVEQFQAPLEKAELVLFAAQSDSHCLLWFALVPQDNPTLGVGMLKHVPWPKKLCLRDYPALDDPSILGGSVQGRGSIDELPTLGQPLLP